MSNLFWKEITNELKNGTQEHGHPFRYVTLGTIGLERMPRLRTVVLREVKEDLNLVFYTDRRSKKVLHIKENNRVSLLFYHPSKLLQIKVEGLATIHSDESKLQKYWDTIAPKNRRDYTSVMAPGSTIPDSHTVEYLSDENYFCMIEIEPFKIEYLSLKESDHLKIRFSKEGNFWRSNFLVP